MFRTKHRALAGRYLAGASFELVLVILANVALSTSAALAQFRPAPNPFQEPDASSFFAWRAGVLLIGAVLGFVVGALFSPTLRAFRRVLFFGLIACIGLYALFGSFPIADAVGYYLSYLLFFVTF